MSKGKNGMGISVGSSSILVAFVVLCLTTFATLSLVSARADYQLTQKNAQATAEYYAADTKAEETLQQLSRALGSGGDWREQILWMEDAAVSYQVLGGDLRLFYYVPVGERKRLEVELSAELGADGNPTGSLRRLRWQTRMWEPGGEEGQMNPANLSHLPIFKIKGVDLWN